MLQDLYGEGLYSLCYRVSMARIIFSMFQDLHGEGLYSLCYRVSMARIIFSNLYVTGSLWRVFIFSVLHRFLWQGIVFSMLQGLYGEYLYSLCYRVSMARIIFSMLQGLYGEY